MFRKIAAATCLLAVGSTATAQTQARPCITAAENEAVVAYVMPDLIGALENRCARVLPADAFLGTQSGALKGKLQPQSDRAWPKARKTAQRITGTPMPVTPGMTTWGRSVTPSARAVAAWVRMASTVRVG